MSDVLAHGMAVTVLHGVTQSLGFERPELEAVGGHLQAPLHQEESLWGGGGGGVTHTHTHTGRVYRTVL